MDNIVVLKGAPNPENAKLFVNFMMEPEHAAMVSNFARYATAFWAPRSSWNRSCWKRRRS